MKILYIFNANRVQGQNENVKFDYNEMIQTVIGKCMADNSI